MKHMISWTEVTWSGDLGHSAGSGDRLGWAGKIHLLRMAELHCHKIGESAYKNSLISYFGQSLWI